MTDVNQAHGAKNATSNAARSFTVAALTMSPLWAVSGTVSVEELNTNLNALLAASPEGTLALAVFYAGTTVGVGLATLTAAEALVGPKKEEGYNKKAVGAGVLTGLIAAAALAWSLTTKFDDSQVEAPAHPVTNKVLSSIPATSSCPSLSAGCK